jgi:hypothetical protein
MLVLTSPLRASEINGAGWANYLTFFPFSLNILFWALISFDGACWLTFTGSGAETTTGGLPSRISRYKSTFSGARDVSTALLIGSFHVLPELYRPFSLSTFFVEKSFLSVSFSRSYVSRSYAS